MKPKFEASQFRATPFASAEDKAKFANHFVRFVNSDFKYDIFYDWFYKRLSMTFGHIAHYNSIGFDETFFRNTEGKINFLQICAAYPCYGDPEHTFSDVEKALIPYIREKIRDYVSRASRETEAAEQAELARLKAKYAIRPEVAELLEKAKAFVAQKKAEGWTQKDFANALKQLFDEVG